MRVRATILVKLLVALVVPVVALFTLFAFVAYEVSRHDLDAELGRRLQAIAASAAVQVRDGKYLSELAATDSAEPLYTQAVARLRSLMRPGLSRNDDGTRVSGFQGVKVQVPGANVPGAGATVPGASATVPGANVPGAGAKVPGAKVPVNVRGAA